MDKRTDWRSDFTVLGMVVTGLRPLPEPLTNDRKPVPPPETNFMS
ncbi:hypothetical protein [Oscillatoria acuminata]|nr:hypothetical protein [Oscillatoria acuminata]